ncbi:transcription termination factor MTEF1, chloroplastic isoform X2 [Phalaenopsis equestris]|uniref:transcription termination factor MTEF1, chloroplastic isoform X2 n=1 Tax=Phalaenopsis equestris TaxID=78828 RepID=UPI0009E59807|nr:transcription termination factor MTEF1, chloroplastic isoform X2 [Phalaenopsis equestris]
MSSLHCLTFPAPCSSISKNGGINLTTPNAPNLSAKPSSLNPHNALHQNYPDFPLFLPDLSSDAREKILSLEIMGIDSSRALALHPDLRAASPDSIHSVISFLLSKGIHHKDLGRILGMCPRVMTSSIGKDLVPVFKFLSCDLKVPDSEFRRVIKKCPRFLVCDVRDQLRPALIYLQRLGFKDVTALAFHDPVLFVSSVENTLMPKLQHLMRLGLSREEAVGMVLRCPSLLTFSIQNNYKPKYEYFVREMGGGLEELKDFPQFFAFSLDKRIKLRHRVMAEMGLRLPLSLMLKSTDNEFKELLMQRGSGLDELE